MRGRPWCVVRRSNRRHHGRRNMRGEAIPLIRHAQVPRKVAIVLIDHCTPTTAYQSASGIPWITYLRIHRVSRSTLMGRSSHASNRDEKRRRIESLDRLAIRSHP